MPMAAAPVTTAMMTAPVHILCACVGDIILIGNRRLGCHILIRLRAVHQIMLRGQHRSRIRGRRSSSNCTCAGSDAERKFQEITTFHQLFSLWTFLYGTTVPQEERTRRRGDRSLHTGLNFFA